MIFVQNRQEAVWYRELMKTFLDEKLSLTLHACNDVILLCTQGLKFLGCMLYLGKRKLLKHVWNRVLTRTEHRNISSYSGLIRAHSDKDMLNYFDWHVLDMFGEWTDRK